VGAEFEGSYKVSLNAIEKHISKFMRKQNAVLLYTDDSAMTLALSEALLSPREGSPKTEIAIAKSFQSHFAKGPERGYGPGAADLIPRILTENPADPFSEAAQMFDGTGSYGNGAAMRVSPVALFAPTISECIELTKLQSRITHAHTLAINGALMQVIAIKLALEADKENFDRFNYLEDVLKEMKQIETDKPIYVKSDSYVKYYCNIIPTIKHYLQEYDGKVLDAVKITTLRTELGNKVSAHRSVPMAFFMFLFTLNRELTFENSFTGATEQLSPFCNAIVHCIAMGGDTDTIASMCASICGAFYGSNQESIPESWIKACESNEIFVDIADQLFNLCDSKN